MSTRAGFLIAGMGMSSWAPLVPFAKERLAANEATLGALLLCLGVGSLISMPLTGLLTSRLGCRRVALIASLVMCVSLVMLAVGASVPAMAITLLFFGAAVGAVDVAMNIQAVIVEKASGRSMMSGFHGFYSLGGIVGAAGVSGALWFGMTPFQAVIIMAALLAVILALSATHFLPYGSSNTEPMFARPRGRILLLGGLCFIVFLAEGSVLDWGAVFLISMRDVDPAHAGLGFATFSIAMTIARLTGDRIVQALGGFRILLWGGICAAAGFLLIVLVPFNTAAFIGFALVGLGASNIVPVLFTAAGNQTLMPVGLAISTVASMGYAGILVGPALIGFIAEFSNLAFSFGLVALGLLVLASCAGRVTRG
jgi:MFS family permease